MRVMLQALVSAFGPWFDKEIPVWIELGGEPKDVYGKDIGVIPFGGEEVTVSKDDFETDFSNHPVSLSEIRNKDKATWSPRDALVHTLRQIDSGERKVDSLVIITSENSEGGAVDVDVRVSSKGNFNEIVGMMEQGKMHYYFSGEQE